jgi:SAM-dependent methyltransferase
MNPGPFKNDKTIDYYNANAQAFYQRTIEAVLSESWDIFLQHLPPKAHILDAGCGSGRDAKYFLKKGYKVTAFDASQEMVNLAAQETGLPVFHLCFADLAFQNEFDGVWAQASLLHIPYQQTRAIYQKIHQALKPQGIFFASYKYGDTYMPTAGRDFWNMNEVTVLPYLKGLFEVIKIWKAPDTRSKVSPSKDQAWLNFIVKKI